MRTGKLCEYNSENPYFKLFLVEKCEQRKCDLWQANSTKSDIPCNSNNVGYRFQCDTCQDRGQTKIYEGDNLRSARIRGAEHLRDLKNENLRSSLFKHKQSDHINEETNFKMQITKRFKDPLSRQAN